MTLNEKHNFQPIFYQTFHLKINFFSFLKFESIIFTFDIKYMFDDHKYLIKFR